MSAWLLPDHIADGLPSEARHIEELRRELLDTARGYGYELIMPPLLEHLDSLLSGAGRTLDLQTFKLVDQLSGKSLGLRADTTMQAARIDAHLLNRRGVTRLCYCGPVLHTRPASPRGSREPLQFGAEIYGHAGLEAELESIVLALDCLAAARVGSVTVDLADVRIVDALLADAGAKPAMQTAITSALSAKDAAVLAELTAEFPIDARRHFAALLQLYGDARVLDAAEAELPALAPIAEALSQLRWLAERLRERSANVTVTFDLADLRGYAYYSGIRFALYASGSPEASPHGAFEALARGGRYDEVGAAFGRKRPAVGFSLDLKTLVAAAAPRPRKAAIRAPWGEDQGLRAAIAALRLRGDTVVCVLPGQDSEIGEFECDRVLVQAAGQWVVQAA